MTIIIKPPIAGLSQQDLLATLDSMRTPGDPPIRTGGGGFVVDELLAHRFLAALIDAAPPPLPGVEVTTWDPTIPPHPPPAVTEETAESTPTPAPDDPPPATPRKTTTKTRRKPR
jgi:hypothetical protein